MKMNKVGMYFAYWTDSWNADYKYYLNKIAGLGFDVFEAASAQILEMSKLELDELKKLAQDRGVDITYCIGLPKQYDMASEDASVRRTGIEYVKRTLEAIYYMEGKIFGGINYSSWPGVLKEGITDKRPYTERCLSSMREAIKTAEDYGITYCLEVVNRFEHYLINTAAEGVSFCEEVGSPNIKLLLDVFHMNIEEDSMEGAIITAGDRLGHFHIGETNRKAPGKGRMPWDEIMGALRKIGYQGSIVMEPFERMGGEVGRDIKVWRDTSSGEGKAALDRDAKAALDFIRSKLKCTT